jgi:uncharacterized protein YndB with AHSA1/START domain
MNERAKVDAYGALSEPATLTIQRMLPGPIERVWAYLTESDLRRKWLASGDMEMKVGAPFELDPPRKLAFTWGKDDSDVTLTLEPRGEKVLLTVIHRRLPTRGMMVGVSTGWHAHLDMLAVRLSGEEAEPFWDRFSRLKAEYDRRIPQ